MTGLTATIGQVMPPRSVSAGGVDETWFGGSDMADTTCGVENCDRTDLIARGWCDMHYRRWRTHGDVGPAERLTYDNSGSCRHPDGCAEPASRRGWCALHYDRMKRNGEPGPVHRLQVPNGSWSRNSGGYAYRRRNGKHEYQHRIVMEQVLGRPLEDFETVHHVNGIRHDNRPENLELWVVPQPYGQRASDLAQWVVDTYPELVAPLFQDSLSRGNDHATTT